MLFVKVAECEAPEETIEVPVEPQGHILMSTLTAQFPGACGLKIKTGQSSWRGVRVIEDKIYPPGDDQWDSKASYFVTYPKDSKRKGDDLDINSAKTRKIERKCVDLIVLGIPWKSTEDIVRQYFEQYGEVVLCEIKRDFANNSKGFGFVRFKEYNDQCSVLGKKHFIDGRWCDVKIPNSQEPETSRKIFVGRLSENLSTADLQDYFSQYGQVIDVYIPKPFRAFGFVTFVEADVAQGLCGESHIIKGVSVHVSRADPKDESSMCSSGKYSQSVHNLNRELDNRRFTSNNHSQSCQQMSTPQKGTKSRKFEHNNFDSFERRSDIRSPNMSTSFSNHNNSTINNVPNKNFANKDHIAAMMNMFNPMMVAFIQQLATQSNLMQQGTMDLQNTNGTNMVHRQNSMPNGVPAPQWSGANGHMQSNHMNPSSGLGINPNHNYNSRYSNEKRF